jgi:hypothetical protein
MKKSSILVAGLCVLAVAGLTAVLVTALGPHKGHAAEIWWQPTNTGPNKGAEFQWELGHALRTSNSTDMGLSALNAAGNKAPAPTIYDIDGIDNSAATVTALHEKGDKVICYIEVGSAGNYYAASDEGIPVSYYAQLKAAGDFGTKMSGYPEYYVNINSASTVSIIESMIKQQCAGKGFDAVEPDIDDSYTDKTGFKISEAQNIAYDQKLAAYTHNLGLAWGQKNGDNDPAFSRALEPTTDFLLTEECNFYKSCGIVTPPYVKAHKLVLNVEYTDDWGSNSTRDLGKFCPADIKGGINGSLFNSSLSGWRRPCQ